MGCSFRRCYVSLDSPPADHGATIIRDDKPPEFIPMADYHCDSCNEVISGQIVVCLTTTPPGREIGAWEHEVGRLLTDAEVKHYQTLSKP